MKSLFIFRNNAPTSFEVFADNLEDAHQEIKRLTGDTFNNRPVLQLITQNYNCPKCGCHASECNYEN